jgi:rhodanese-related sulfurtransferase
MNWITVLIVAAVVSVFFMLKQSGQISAKEALERLENGALVIDVRSPGEFSSGHLAKAINIPLDAIETRDRNRAAEAGKRQKPGPAAALRERDAERHGEKQIERHGLCKRL